MTEDRRWRKSRRSGQNNECVELPNTLDAVRDTKNGTILSLTRHAVTGLLTAAKRS